jgi:magnesium transporter
MSQDPRLTTLVEELAGKPPLDAAQALVDLSPQDIQFVLERLEGDHAAAVASHLPELVAPEDAATRAVLQAGAEGAVGELMGPTSALLPADRTVAEAMAFLVKSAELPEIKDIFVTREGRLAGIVNMRDLLLAKPSNALAEIMDCEPATFHIDTSLVEAVGTIKQHHYDVYPVVNDAHHVVGRVHAWKIYEHIAEELSAQAGTQYGVSRDEQINTPVLAAFRMRHPWLLINLVTAFAAALVVGLFEDTISRVVALAAFLPVLAGQSGNTGCQAMAITLRGITLGKLRDYPVRALLRKEIVLGALNGAVVGVLAGLAMLGYAVATDSINPAMLGVVIVLAMIGSCVGSGIFGVLVPLTLQRFGADPATASSIFLTTFTDVIGMGLMLFLATALVL